MSDVGEASRRDVPEVLLIYNEVIRNSTAVYSEVEFTAERGKAWFDLKTAQGMPFLVARDDTGVVGFATFGEFRTWPCYQYTVEHSVHVRADRRGRGFGRALLQELIEHAKRLQKHVMIGGIDAENLPSINLHKSLGFSVAGYFHQVGFKFERWLDLVFVERVV